MSTTVAFERSHDILIDAPPAAVFDYVTNPKSWPEWLAASHHIDSADRSLRAGETFHEKWHTSKGEVRLDWIVETRTDFIGPIVIRYTCAPEAGGTRYRRTVTNPARPKPPTPEMIARIDEEARIGLGNIKAIVERRHRGG